MMIFTYIISCGVLLAVFAEVKGSCNRGCYYNGICYGHGDKWEADCNTKRCRLDYGYPVTETIGIECKDAYGHCKQHGDEMVVNAGGYLVKCQCLIGHDSWQYTNCGTFEPVNPSTGCNGCKIDGVCRSFGSQFVKDCFTYECRQYGSSWRSDVVRAGCQDINGFCRGEGESMSIAHDGVRLDDCRCRIEGTSARYSCGDGRNKGCNGCEVNGVCHGVNTQWTDADCITRQCTALLGNFRLVQTQGVQCKDAYGRCRNNNEKMDVRMGNQVLRNCNCIVFGNYRSYNCLM